MKMIIKIKNAQCKKCDHQVTTEIHFFLNWQYCSNALLHQHNYIILWYNKDSLYKDINVIYFNELTNVTNR